MLVKETSRRRIDERAGLLAAEHVEPFPFEAREGYAGGDIAVEPLAADRVVEQRRKDRHVVANGLRRAASRGQPGDEVLDVRRLEIGDGSGAELRRKLHADARPIVLKRGLFERPASVGRVAPHKLLDCELLELRRRGLRSRPDHQLLEHRVGLPARQALRASGPADVSDAALAQFAVDAPLPVPAAVALKERTVAVDASLVVTAAHVEHRMGRSGRRASLRHQYGWLCGRSSSTGIAS